MVLGKNKGADTQEPTKEAAVTQEPAAEMEQPHEIEVGTPIVDIDIESRRMPNHTLGWNSEKFLLISELQKMEARSNLPSRWDDFAKGTLKRNRQFA